MNENCTVNITRIDGTDETFLVIDVNQPVWDGCLTPEEYSHRVAEYGITIESLDVAGNKLIRHIPPTCICMVEVFCPC